MKKTGNVLLTSGMKMSASKVKDVENVIKKLKENDFKSSNLLVFNDSDGENVETKMKIVFSDPSIVKRTSQNLISFFTAINDVDLPLYTDIMTTFISKSDYLSLNDLLKSLDANNIEINDEILFDITNIELIKSNEDESELEFNEDSMFSGVNEEKFALLVSFTMEEKLILPKKGDTLLPIDISLSKQEALMDKAFDLLNNETNVQIQIVKSDRKKVVKYGVKEILSEKYLGIVTDENQNYEILDILSKNEDFSEIKFYLTQDDKSPSDISIIVPEKIMPRMDVPEYCAKIVEQIISKKIDTRANLLEKITFMEENNFNEKLIVKIFESYQSIEESVEKNYIKPLKISNDDAVLEKEMLVQQLKSHIAKKPKTNYIVSEKSFVGTKRAAQDNIHKLLAIKVLLGLNIKLEGPKGGGKNTLIDWNTWLFQRPYFSLSLNEDTDNDLLIGGDELRPITSNGKTEVVTSFAPGSFVLAMQYGGMICLDEINTAPNAVLTGLHSALDDHRSLEVKELGKVNANDNFIAFATMNLDYEGTNPTNDATIDRFSQIDLPLSDNLEEVLKSHVPDANKKDIQFAAKIYKDIKNKLSDGITEYGEEADTLRGYIYALKQSVLGLDFKTLLCSELIGRCKSTEAKKSIITSFEKY